MKEVFNNPMVPASKVGKDVDLEQSVTEEFPDEAINTFNRACKRL